MRARLNAQGRSSWREPARRGYVLAPVALLVAGLLLVPAAVPNTVGHLGSLVETFHVWLVLAILVLVGLAWWRRSAIASLAALLPFVAWLGLYGGHMLPGQNSAYDVTAVQHNVSDENPDPAATARGLAKVGPDLIALEELTLPALRTYAATLAAQYPHHTVQGTVGLWSRYPLAEPRLVDLRPGGIGAGWNRGLRAVVRMPQGEIAVYVAHLPSVRLGLTGLDCARRDESAVLLGKVIAAEPLDKVLLLGDLNSTVDDRGLAPVSKQLTTARSDFAFSWPAGAPLARIDQIMGRSMTVTEIWSLPATGSDHLPIAARIRL